jgi:hypothetical protein
MVNVQQLEVFWHWNDWFIEADKNCIVSSFIPHYSSDGRLYKVDSFYETSSNYICTIKNIARKSASWNFKIS